MRHARNLTKISTLSKHSAMLAIALAVVAVASIGTANAQSSSLPPTNMGKFVHQPGDNQYSNSTQAERHAPPPPPPRPTAMMMMPSQSVGYVPVPRVAKPDPTLTYIAADEPIVQAGFPPLPDRADLPGSGSGWSASGGRGGGGGGGNWGPNAGGNDGPGSPGGVDSRIEKKSYNGYRHAEAGAYAPQEPTRHYRSSNTASDSYAVGGGGGGGGGPAANPAASLGKEPSLNPRADQGIVAEAPAPVVVKQATTQDLSLPDDEFSGSSTQQKKNPSGTSRMMKQMGRQMFIQPMMQMSSMGSSMAGRAIHF